MNISQLRPASQLAQRFGVKSVMYGGPGSGKTPLLNTAPRPLLCVAEPGMLSMRNSNIPAYDAYTPERLDEFFKWLKNSSEAKAFDTIGVDSISQVAEIYLRQEEDRNAHGLKAYGEMAKRVMEHMNDLFYMPQKHVYLIAKEMTEDQKGIRMRRPYFPGKDLNVKVPHMYDEILHLGLERPPGFIQDVVAIRTRQSFDCMARDRSGMLNELEEPNLSKLFSKAMS